MHKLSYELNDEDKHYPRSPHDMAAEIQADLADLGGEWNNVSPGEWPLDEVATDTEISEEARDGVERMTEFLGDQALGGAEIHTPDNEAR